MNTKIKIIAIFTFSLFALAFFAPQGKMQTKQIETAGQHFKNIKVLNEMPADQLGKVMNLMSASLGVNCNYCHIGEDFAKDGKEEKETAREMITMTLGLNKNNFGGRTEISCNTCHQGHTHPQSAINFNAPPPEPRPKQPDIKPTIDQILMKYETAVGGKENLAKITSRAISANRVEPDGKTIEPEEILQKGDKLLIITKYPSATVTESFDGANAWKRVNAENKILKPDEIEQIRRNAQIFAFTDLKTIYPKMDYRLTDKIDGREVYLVLATTADNQRERLYFDADTGLLVRRVASTPTVLGNFQYQVDYTDYKDFDGVKLPTTIRYAMPNISWTRKITEVKNNPPIDDVKFNQPTK
ncbi:MAG: c-type cytochrome [Pyrinomonadaceae bacterium]